MTSSIFQTFQWSARFKKLLQNILFIRHLLIANFLLLCSIFRNIDAHNQIFQLSLLPDPRLRSSSTREQYPVPGNLLRACKTGNMHLISCIISCRIIYFNMTLYISRRIRELLYIPNPLCCRVFTGFSKNIQLVYF